MLKLLEPTLRKLAVLKKFHNNDSKDEKLLKTIAKGIFTKEKQSKNTGLGMWAIWGAFSKCVNHLLALHRSHSFKFSKGERILIQQTYNAITKIASSKGHQKKYCDQLYTNLRSKNGLLENDDFVRALLMMIQKGDLNPSLSPLLDGYLKLKDIGTNQQDIGTNRQDNVDLNTKVDTTHKALSEKQHSRANHKNRRQKDPVSVSNRTESSSKMTKSCSSSDIKTKVCKTGKDSQENKSVKENSKRRQTDSVVVANKKSKTTKITSKRKKTPRMALVNVAKK